MDIDHSMAGEMARRKKTHDEMSTAPWRHGETSVYSPYTDRRLWISPDRIQRLGSLEKAMREVLRMDKEGMQMCGNITNKISDLEILNNIEKDFIRC